MNGFAVAETYSLYTFLYLKRIGFVAAGAYFILRFIFGIVGYVVHNSRVKKNDNENKVRLNV